VDGEEHFDTVAMGWTGHGVASASIDSVMVAGFPRYPRAYLGRLFGVWVHEFSELCGVDRVLVDRIELG
jgi:hypothetical protein